MSGETQSKQLLHLVLGGELTRIGDVEFKDLNKIDVVGVYPGPVVIVRLANGEMLHVHAHDVVLATGASELHPVCDKGGDVRKCLLASKAVIEGLESSIKAMNSLSAPEKYVKVHASIENDFSLESGGFQERNKAIVAGSDADWVSANQVIQDAASALLRDLDELGAIG